MTATPSSPDRVRSGIVSMLVSVLFFAVMNALAKLLAQDYPLAEVAFFRSAFALIPAAAMLALGGGVKALRTEHLFGHFWRAVIGLTSMILLFLSYHLMPLADAVALSFSAPLFLTMLSVPILGERVGPYRWGAVAVGFVGVLIIVQPGSAMFNTGALVGVGAAVSYSFAMIAIRQLGRTEATVTTVFYFTVFSTLLSALALPFTWVTPSLHGFGLMALMGLVGGGAQYFLTRAYVLAPAVVVSPFNYAGILWATLFGWLLWGDRPGVPVLVGAAIVIASGLMILYRETRRKTETAPPAVETALARPDARAG
ncbi:DMT family transporter [Azospirillum doebereinerae]